MNSKPILIVGKTSKTGSRVNSLLKAQGYETRALSRSTNPSFDWQDPSNWSQVMAGCEIAYVTFQPDLAVPSAQTLVAEFLLQAKVAGIRHIVLLSGRGEDGAQKAERLLMNCGLGWNVVRASWFNQNFSEGFMIDGVLSGEIVLPAGDIKEPFIDVDDIAEVAVACINRRDLANQVFEVTGPELLSFRECAAILSEELGRPINFLPVDVDDFLGALRGQGFPDEVMWLMNELFSKVLDGRNSNTVNGVQRALGRPATSFRQYVQKTLQSGVWNVVDTEEELVEAL